MTQSELKLDGNAIAGLLSEIFAVEMTLAEGTCGACGNVDAVGGVDVYTNAPGVVARCRACGQVLMRIVRTERRVWIDMSGIRCLELKLSTD